MNEKNQTFYAYLATLAALVVVFIAALIAARNGVNVTEAYGLGAITGGLIGILRLPTQRNMTVDNSSANPVPTKDAKP
jgi:hypothetical protein